MANSSAETVALVQRLRVKASLCRERADDARQSQVVAATEQDWSRHNALRRQAEDDESECALYTDAADALTPEKKPDVSDLKGKVSQALTPRTPKRKVGGKISGARE